MKVYYSPGACSLASHIAMKEAGAPFNAEVVNLKTHQSNGKDYYQVIPRGSVPAIEMENGEILKENAVIMQYIADLKPEQQMIPRFETLEHYRAEEWLNFIATEVHKGFAPFSSPDLTPDVKKKTEQKLENKFAILREVLEKNPYMIGQQCSIVDFYLFVMLSWAGKFDLDRSRWPEFAEFVERMSKRPSVAAALSAESMH